jgi:CRP/FNR family cyclic AMP-dependent transcriptional regulator
VTISANGIKLGLGGIARAIGLAGPLKSDLDGFLQTVFLCSPEVAQSIGKRALDRRFAVRALLLKQGDRAGSTFLLVTGRAHALTYGLGGQEVLLREFLPGDFFGAIALAEPAPEDADVVAVEAVRAAVFLALDFLGLIETYGCVGLVVSQALLKQLRATSAKMLARTTLSAAGRVHAELLRLARLGDGRTIRPAPVLTALAVRVLTTRETVSRTISALETSGVIRREAKSLFIVSPRTLEDMIV